ncbi:MAG TPA: hypothetical protein VLZ03_11440, partial [Thermodesulfobacteriota bacterium]|nr:hypothetical protein [Thermodesulfobacteriota bacterium]
IIQRSPLPALPYPSKVAFARAKKFLFLSSLFSSPEIVYNEEKAIDSARPAGDEAIDLPAKFMGGTRWKLFSMKFFSSPSLFS